MPASRRRQNHTVQSSARKPTPVSIGRRAWLAPPIGAALIVGLAAAASLAQATEWIFIVASLVFSLCEGLVLALVGFTWSSRGIRAAIVAAAVTAAVAAPARWEVGFLMRYGQPVPRPTDLLEDLLISIAWGAIVGLAGATVLRPKLAALMRDDRTRFTPPR